MNLSRSSLKLVLFLVFFVSSFVSAQLDYNWAKGFGLLATDLGRGITTDAAGNIFLTGEFSNNSTGGGTLTFPGGVTMSSQGNADYFLVKFNSSGTALWARTAGSGAGAFTERGYGVELDHSGNIITAGHFFNTTTWQGGGGSNVTITSAGNLDGFTAKYNSSGDLAWVKVVKGVSQISARKVGVDQNNNIICNGYFGTSSGNDSANFSGVIPTLHSPTSSRDWYTVKYDSNGTALWARSAGGRFSDETSDLIVDPAGNIYVCGFSSSTTNFGSYVVNCDTTGDFKNTTLSDAVVAKYSPSGDIIWAKNFGGKKADIAYGLALDGLGNLYVSGTFDSAAVFGSLGSLVSNGGPDAFLLKMDTSGTPIWVRNGGGTSTSLTETGYKVVIDKSGNPWMCGTFQGTANFGGFSVTSLGSQDAFFAQYNPSGTILLLKRAGGSAGNDQPLYMAVEPNGNIIATGAYAGTPDFGTTTLSNAGGSDFFLSEIGGRALTLTSIIEGPFENLSPGVMENDVYPLTVTVQLRDASTYALIDSKTGDLSPTGVGTFNFSTAVNGTPYYIAVKSSNTSEVQSSSTQSFTAGAASYDFTSGLTQAYTDGGGVDPMILKGGKWCLYSGDVNQDGAVDAFDLSPADNDNVSGGTPGVPSGYPTDINGDGGVDAFDLSIIDNNNSRGVYSQLLFSPMASKGIIHHSKSQVKNKNIK